MTALSEAAAEQKKNKATTESGAKVANHSIKEGFLFKKGEKIGSKFVRRYFFLFANELQYYTDKHGDKKVDFHFYKDAVVTIEKASFSVTPFPTSKKYTFQTNSESDANDWAIEIRKQVGFEVLTGLAAWFAVAWLACGWWPWCVVFVFSFLTVVSTQAETQEYHKPEKK